MAWVQERTGYLQPSLLWSQLQFWLTLKEENILYSISLQAVSINPKANLAKNFHTLKALSRDQEITAFAWSDPDTQTELLLGHRNQTVKVFSATDAAFKTALDVSAAATATEGCAAVENYGPVVGLCRSRDAIATASQSGYVRLWRHEDPVEFNAVEVEIRNTSKFRRRTFEDEEAEAKHLALLKAGRELAALRRHVKDDHILATGGKENELQLWDMNRPDAGTVFAAKNVRPDFLEHRVPVWVTGVAFPDPSNSSLVSIASRHGHVRLYDARAGENQRRPVGELFFPDEALTAISATPNPNQVLVGSSKGRIALFDFRKEHKGTQGLFRKYKGCVGAVRSIDCIPDGPYFSTVGLDRFLRIYELSSKKSVHNMYLKSRLNHVLLRNDFDPEKSERERVEDSEKALEDDLEILEETPEVKEEEKMWQDMAVVGGSESKKKKRKEAASVSSSTEGKKKKKK